MIYCPFIYLTQCIFYTDFTLYHQIVQGNYCVKLQPLRDPVQWKKDAVAHWFAFVSWQFFKWVTIWQKGRERKAPKLIFTQLNQPHFSRSLLQMTFNCFPNPEPPSVNKDYLHRSYWEVCAVDSKSHFKSSILKIFGAVAVRLNWETNSLKIDTGESSTYLGIYVMNAYRFSYIYKYIFT